MANRQNEIVSLLREILKNTSSGSIIETNELPDAEKNRNKLIRLTSDNGLYVSDYKGSTSTNRLPDEQQIDKAYLYTGDHNPHYKGTYKIICTDGELDWFLWENQAENYMLATALNAVECTPETPIVEISTESVLWSDITETSATTTMTMQEVKDFDIIAGYANIIPAIYNAPESAQIGNATLVDNVYAYTGAYDGTQVTFIDSDGEGEEVTGYKWIVDGETDFIATSKPASEIYFSTNENDGTYEYYTDVQVWVVFGNNTSERSSVMWDSNNNNLYIPQLNAPDSEQVGAAYLVNYEDNFYYKGTALISDGTQTITAYRWQQGEVDEGYNNLFTVLPASEIFSANDNYFSCYGDWHLEDGIYKDDGWDVIKLSEVDIDPYIIKYQRTEGIWEWRKL